ncbi:hypothetical protein J2Z76_002010 [Sedimentibacter acidaminivorans]|uniref:DUF2812 domain-containing protein n=1 Tax=Sedimentibacter acidaminivorans TaxID=913099 RepID=A0ABS4GEM6_9FIRM|nr:DUF2812 domain-containing protein [Sedimentibacter acidaminivorans]MBP1926146.1 hypothetical protein [Sedimentibacter acidaminivorans]
MERNKKKKINWRFKKLEYKLMEEYLEEMAIKGWMPSEIDNNKAIFVKIDPRQLKFCVSISPYKSTLIHDVDDDLIDEYRSSCEALGWHYITSYDQMYFFYAEKYENTYRIHTDPELEQKIVLDNVWKKELFRSIGIFIYFIAITWMNFFTEGYLDYRILVNWFKLLTMFFLLPLACIVSITPVITNLIWYFKVKSNMNYNVSSKSLRFVKLRNAVLDIESYTLIVLLVPVLGYYFFPKGILDNWTTNLFLITILSITVCCFYLYFKEKTSKTVKMLSIFSIFIGITILIYIMAQSSLSNEISNANDDIQIISYKYPVIKISDFADIGEIDSNSFNKSYSPLVPNGYIYSEDYNDAVKGKNYDVTTEYYKCISEKVASIVYDGIIADYENGKYFRGNIENIYEKNWNCDKVTLITDSIFDNEILVLLKDSEVIKIEISDNLINIYDEKYRQKILEKFMNYI